MPHNEGSTAILDVADPDDAVAQAIAQRARLTVCNHATDVDDARDLLAALGLIEVDVVTSLRCNACNERMQYRREGNPLPPGVRGMGAKGMCATCYQDTLRTPTQQVGGVA